jgi:hypothetical protein
MVKFVILFAVPECLWEWPAESSHSDRGTQVASSNHCPLARQIRHGFISGIR